jgi:hypothetical protein
LAISVAGLFADGSYQKNKKIKSKGKRESNGEKFLKKRTPLTGYDHQMVRLDGEKRSAGINVV